MNDITRVLVPVEPHIVRVIIGAGGEGGGGFDPELVEWRIETLAEAPNVNIPLEIKRVTIERYANDRRLSEATYEETDSGGSVEPPHPGKFQAKDGRWFVIAESEIDARMLGCYCDHDGTYTGGHDDTESFRNFVAVLASIRRPGTWTGGIVLDGATLTANGPISVPVNTATFELYGRGDRMSYIYLRGEFDDFFLQIEDRLGLWSGDVAASYVAGRSPAPPFNQRRTRLANFSVYGEGSLDDGTPQARQKGISWNARQDNVYVDRVYLYNICGCAAHMGRSVAGEKNGIRESRIEHLVTYRCGDTDEPAWIVDGGEDASFGPNFVDFMSCECSVSRGDGLLVRNTNPNNSMHELRFDILKLHGTGADVSHFPPLSRRALIVEGQCTNSLIFDHVSCVQYASQPGDYLIHFATGHGRLYIDEVGALAGNMISMAAAFDRDRAQVATACAAIDAATSGWIAMQLPAATRPMTIARALVYGSSDQGYVVGSTPTVTLRLYGKAGAEPASLAECTLIGTATRTDKPGVYAPLNSNDIDSLFDWIVVEISTPTPANLRICEIVPFTRVDAWPTSVQFQGALSSGDNGILVDGGGNHRIEISDARLINGNLLRVAPIVNKPIWFSPPPDMGESQVACDAAGSSHLIHIEGIIDDPPIAWSQLARQMLSAAVTNNTTADLQIPSLIANAPANSRIVFTYRIYYKTTAVADFRYTIIVTGGTATSLSVIQKHLPPEAVAWTTLAPSTSLPVGVRVPELPAVGAAGQGAVDIQVIAITGAAALQFFFRFAQNATDTANPTTVLPGSMLTVQI